MKQKLDLLQIGRGIAALFVVLAHATMYINQTSVLNIFFQGTTGVVFFFILSGFIIFYGNHHLIGSGAGYLRFGIRRALRVYPVYWIYTTIALIISAMQFLRTGQPLMDYSDFRIIDYIHSFFLYPFTKKGSDWPFLPVAWTLSYELIFYFAFSLAIFFRKKVVYCVAALWFLGIVLGVSGGIDVSGSLPTTFLLFNEILGFFAGMAIAWVVLRFPAASAYPRRAMTVLMAGSGLLMAAWLTTHWKWSAIVAMPRIFSFGIPYAMIVFGMVSLERGSKLDFSSPFRRFAVHLGDASYSVYLVHYWILSLLNRFHGKIHNDIVYYLFSVTIAVGLGLLAYRYIERPLLEYLVNRSRQIRPLTIELAEN